MAAPARTVDGLPPVSSEMLCSCGLLLGAVAADFAQRVLQLRADARPAPGSYQDALPVYRAFVAPEADVQRLLDAYGLRDKPCCRTRLLGMRTLPPPS